EELAAALAADRATPRARLGAMVERPEVAEALFVASPSLVEALDTWGRDPDGKKGLRAERALVRYFLRMASRATPFGLFSGCSTAPIDSADPAGVPASGPTVPASGPAVPASGPAVPAAG